MTNYTIPQRRVASNIGSTRSTEQHSTSWRSTYVVSSCGRCGESFQHHHYCKALNRQCYVCRMYGHHAKVCDYLKNKNAPKSPSVHHASSAKVNINSSDKMKIKKSAKKQNRDRVRLMQFRERKAMCFEMPFYSLDILELYTMGPRNSCRVNNSKNEMTTLRKNYKEVLEQTTAIESEVLQLQTQYLSALTQAEQAKLQLQELETIKATMSQLQEQCNNERKQKEQLQCELNKMEMDKKTLIDDNNLISDHFYAIQKQLRKVSEFNKEDRESLLQILDCADGNIKALSSAVCLLKFPPRQGNPHKQKSQRPFYCEDCGSSSYHPHQRGCPARDHSKCKLCDGDPHFATLCKKPFAKTTDN